MACIGFVFDVRGIDCDTTCFFFRSRIDFVVLLKLGLALLGQYQGDRRSQRGFAVVNVTNGANTVYIGFVSFKLLAESSSLLLLFKSVPAAQILSFSPPPLISFALFGLVASPSPFFLYVSSGSSNHIRTCPF